MEVSKFGKSVPDVSNLVNNWEIADSDMNSIFNFFKHWKHLNH